MKRYENIKVGDVFYEFRFSLDYMAREKAHYELWEYHVTSIDKRGVFLKCKTDSTWGKLSSKNGDYGWLPNIHSIWKIHIKPGENHIDSGLYTSKKLAYKSDLASLRKSKAFVTRLVTRIEKM